MRDPVHTAIIRKHIQNSATIFGGIPSMFCFLQHLHRGEVKIILDEAKITCLPYEKNNGN
jgi:hypothetical protein